MRGEQVRIQIDQRVGVMIGGPMGEFQWWPSGDTVEMSAKIRHANIVLIPGWLSRVADRLVAEYRRD